MHCQPSSLLSNSDLSQDEETPLLAKRPPTKTPLPWFQLSIVLFLQMAEPLTSQVLYPFGPQLIRDVGITNGDESQVGHYVGLMQSMFFFAQALTVLHWSSISDRIGRKPVILFGLCGLSLTMFGFGLSKTFTWLVLTRCLCGALNGNIGVIKSIMAEITDDTNRAQMFAFVPMAWSAGGTLGPLIGGWLNHPAEQFPKVFSNSDFNKKYPYFLPCAAPAIVSAIAWLVTLLFLKETVHSPIPVSEFLSCSSEREVGTSSHIENSCQSIHDYDSSSDTTKNDADGRPLPLRDILTPRVLLASGSYALLCLVDISFRALQPVFFSTPINMGGLGFPSSTIGNVLSAYGILNCVFQLCFFPRVHRRLGTKRVLIFGLLAAIPGFALFPLLSYLGRAEVRMIWLWVVILVQIGFMMLLNMTYGAIFIYVSASSPNPASLGTVNGLSQMMVSLTRAVGPAFTNSLFSLTMENNYAGGMLVYFISMGVVVLSVGCSAQLPRVVWND